MNNPLKFVLVLCTTAAFAFLLVDGQTLNQNRRYCFSFTWLGPKYNNDSAINNATCDDFTKLATNVPCRSPLVITDDGTYPDIDFLMENHDADVTCELVEGESCAKYIYRFDGSVQNITHMCTKVVTDDERTVSPGCYVSSSGSRQTEVCICRTATPGAQPCNGAEGSATPTVLGVLLLTTAVVVNSMFN